MKKPKSILSEEYVVHFQHEVEGITKYETYSIFREFKAEHEEAEAEFLKQFAKSYKKLKITKVVYQ